jgi:hypothetical protein
MLVTYFTHISRTAAKLMVLLLFFMTNLNAQVSYSCYCDDSFPDGVVGFDITVFGNGPGEIWTVDNVINLYSSVDPLIVLSDGTQLEADPMNPSHYVLSGFAFSGIMPFVTILDDMGTVNDVNMITCMIPDGEITGDNNICLGTSAELEFDVSTMNILPGSTEWSAPGASTAVPSGPDNLRLTVEYDMPGSYIVNVSTRSSTNCEVSDDFIINVFDAADGMEISGPDYLCLDNASDVMYAVSNPDMYELIWSSNPGGVTFDPFLGNPMTGSGSAVMADFPSVGTYTFEVGNADINGCLIEGVEYTVQIVDAIDTIQIIGETYACVDNIEAYTIANAGEYSNLEWSISPMMGVVMTPADGLAETVEIEYLEVGNYQLSLTGMTADGCSFLSVLDITAPDDAIESIACNNSVNVSLNNNCILELQADMILEGDILDNDAYEIIIEDVITGELLPGNMVSQEQLGSQFKVTVIQKCGGNSCWGNLVVEDKSVTPLDQYCSDAPIVTTCYEFGADPANPLGFPDFPVDASWTYNSNNNTWLVSGFDNCSDALLSYEDEVLSNDVCEDPQLVRRTWTAVDINNGEFTTCEVIIQLSLTDKNSIIWPNDYDSTLDADPIGGMDTDGIFPSLDPCNFQANENLLCGDLWFNDANGNPSPECTGAPVSDGFSCPNLQVIGYTDRVLPVCGSSKKILRQWTVWDACDLTDIMHTQIITLMDTVPPVCEAPMNTQITTDVHECGTDIYVEPPIVTGECDDFSYTIKYSIKGQYPYGPSYFTNENVTYDPEEDRYVINDVEFDTDSIWVQYIVRDACGNRANDCYAEFELIDDEQPVPACDLNNFVTLNQFGEAWVGPSTFDDNSWDNCGVYQTVVQRMDDRCECAVPRFDFLHSLGEYNGHYYYLSKERMHAGKAFALAAALDGYVTRIDSLEENEWIRSQVDAYAKDASYYIGLSGVDTNSLFWQSGDSNYENWDLAEPELDVPLKKNERVYAGVNEDGQWYAEGRNQLDLYYVLELEDVCTWSQKISFCCADVGQETMVALKVIDWHGNHNQCMVNVRVMDFIPPIIDCPDDVRADCDENFDESDLSNYGEATAIDDCGTVTIHESSNINPLNCGEFIISRTFTAKDVAGNESSCTQTIRLENENPFTFDDINWPKDTLLIDEICYLEDIGDEITGVPSWDEASFPCSNLTYTYDDLIFYIAEGACQKLVRTWTVVDWCQPERLWEYSQVIKLINTIQPEISPSSCSNMIYEDAEALGNCLVRIDDLTAELSENQLSCTKNPIWRYRIDLYNNGQFEISGNGNDASGEYPYGVHRVEWEVTDDCDNVTVCDKLINIQDNIPPTAYCHGEIVIPISHTDGVEIWASDLNLASFDDCPSNPIYFSFEENVSVQNMSFDCSHIDSASSSGSHEIDLWVWDNISSSLANKSVCTVTVTIQDNQGVCDDIAGSPVAHVNGMVYTEDIEMVYDVEMHIESQNMSTDIMSTTGEFAFTGLNMYEDYSIEAFKNDNPLNGVSTLDLLLIQRHILGLEYLDTPYKIIAADIDNSQSISAIDLIELRKLILGIYSEFKDNYSWRFVEADFQFLDPQHPFPFSENIELEDLEVDVNDADFIAVKIGDVNRSAKANDIKSKADSQDNVGQDYTIELSSSVTEKQNTRVQLKATESVNLAGMQFELRFDATKSDFLAAIPMELEIATENIAWDLAEKGLIRFSWTDIEAAELQSGDIMLEFLFSGNDLEWLEPGAKEEMLSELYAETSESIKSRSLEFRNVSNQTDLVFEVHQNVPNPFKDETLIQFNLDVPGPVQFKVTDQTGRLVYNKQYDMQAGENVIRFNSSLIDATGLLYYQISTQTHTATRKMIVIR